MPLPQYSTPAPPGSYIKGGAQVYPYEQVFCYLIVATTAILTHISWINEFNYFPGTFCLGFYLRGFKGLRIGAKVFWGPSIYLLGFMLKNVGINLSLAFERRGGS